MAQLLDHLPESLGGSRERPIIMNRIRRYLRPGSTPAYERLNGDDVDGDQAWKGDDTQPEAFSWFTYSVFLLLGISMLWAW